jgi:hypothetical protein
VEAPAPPPALARPRYSEPGRSVPGTSCSSRYALAALVRAATAITRGDGGRHMVALREAMSLTRLVRAGLLSEAEVTQAIQSALQVPGRHTAGNEAANLVGWAMRNTSDRPLVLEGRP